MTALIPEPFVAVTPTLVRTFGPVCAIVLQEIYFETLVGYIGGPTGETTATQQALAERTGLSPDQVYRATRRLSDLGVLVAVKRRLGGSGDHSVTYTVDMSKIPESSRAAAMPKPGTSRDSATRTSRAIAESSVLPETEREEQDIDPLPPERGKSSNVEQLAGQISIVGDIEHRSETKRRTSRTLDPIAEASFRQWWERYPRHGKGAPGSLERARSAWTKAVRSGISPAELDERLDSYRAARARWTEATGDPCWLLAAPRFIRESEEFDHEMTDAEIFSRWNHDKAPTPGVEPTHPPGSVGAFRDLQAAWYGAEPVKRRAIEFEAAQRQAARAAS